MTKENKPDESATPPSSAGLLFIKMIVGFTVLSAIWLIILRDTKLDPLLQVSATVSHFAAGDQNVSIDDLVSKVTSQEDKKVYNKAVTKLKQGSYYGSARDLTRLGAKYPTLNYPLGQYYLKRGQELYNEGKYRQASECLKISVDYFIRQSGKAHHLLAMTSEKLGNSDDSKKHHKLAETYKTSQPNVPFDPVYTGLSLFVTLGLAIFIGLVISNITAGTKNSKKTESKKAAEKTWVTPDTTDGSINEEEQQYGSITKVLTAEDRLQQAVLLMEENQFDDAFEIFRKAVALNPGVSATVSKMSLDHGILRYNQNELEIAARLFEVALQHTPHDLHCHTYLANCCIKLNLYDKAVHHYLNVVRINPENATGYYNLGICYHKTGDLEHAMRSFEVATEKESMPNAHFYLAKLNEETGEKDKATKHWKRCAELAPDTPQGKRAIERLSQLG